MKYLFSIIILFSIWTCSSKPEPKLELSNPEAFSFDLGDSWEVTASVNVKGFAQNENNDEFSAKLSFTVDLLTPNSDSLVALYNDLFDEINNEEFMDIILEAQLEIDNSFGEGDYRLIFNVNDDLSGLTKSISVDFNLTK